MQYYIQFVIGVLRQIGSFSAIKRQQYKIYIHLGNPNKRLERLNFVT